MTSPAQPQFLREGHINGLRLKNRLIKAGTFENMTPGGQPGEALNQFHGRIADGGAAMTTIGYCAVADHGRLNANMMYMHEGLRPALSAMIDMLHARGAAVSGQMGHCGGFSKNAAMKGRIKGPSAMLNTLGIGSGMAISPAMSIADIDAMVQDYFNAARFMKSVGFDAVEIHFGHGYGLCQFISPLTNRRRDEYGGSLENRMRLPLRVLQAVRDAVGEHFPILGKVSMSEGARGGIDYDDNIAICRMLDRAGIDAIVTSGGTSTRNPMLMFRGASILPGIIRHEKSPFLKLAFRLMQPFIFKPQPYHELYFLQEAKRVRDAVNCKLIYVGGASTPESFEKLMAEGFDFVQLGRTLLADPELPVSASLGKRSRCIHCNDCIGTIESDVGIHCPRFPAQ